MDAVAARVFDYEHPMLAQVRDDPSREAAFWARIGEDRTPLITPAPNAERHSIVTYVFPHPKGAKHVAVHPGFGFGRDHVMSRIEGTDICYASYIYRNDTRTSYSFAPNWPLVSWNDCTDTEYDALRTYRREFPLQSDPNHRHFTTTRAVDGTVVATSYFELPDAPDESAIHKRPDVRRGLIERQSFASAIMGNTRNIWVYTPPGYEEGGGAYPVLVAFDGATALSLVPTHRILDNLLAEGAIAPTVAVFVDNPTSTSRNTELPCNEDFASFVEAELMPWLRDSYPKVSRDPRDNFLSGSSYGGLAALWLGLRIPHIFGNAISQGGALSWGPGLDLDVPLLSQQYEPEWLIRQYASAARVPLRTWLEVGLMEEADRAIEPNRRMNALLREKGCDVVYSEPCGGHDYALWRGTLIQALKEMLPSERRTQVV